MLLTLSLGTNLGNRRGNIASALRLLQERFGAPVQKGEVIETVAVGFEGPLFLNLAVRYECSLPPEEVLSSCKRIEAAMGRTDAPQYDSAGQRVYHSRIIDIDILTYGDLQVDTPELRIPHPQVQEREYVKEMLKSLK